MKNKAIIYVTVILAVFVVFIAGYYSALVFENVNGELIVETQEGQTMEPISTLRDTPYLIHGNVEAITQEQDRIILRVTMTSNENFKDSPFQTITRGFIITKESIVNTALKQENEIPIVVLEDSITAVDDDFELQIGDLVVVESSRSFEDILLNFNFFSVLELWKIKE